ncbi:MAG: uroporphyrinogen decarboxylase family protein [Candidatus Ratteibacteria bacterium]
MTPRERWQNVFHFRPVDRIFNMEFGWWTDTLIRWHNEGLPQEVDTIGKGDLFFGFDRMLSVPVNLGLDPVFKTETIEETEKYIVTRDSTGVIAKQFKDGTSSIPHYIKFPIENRSDWLEFKKRLSPDSNRYPSEKDWQEFKKIAENCKNPVIIGGGSLFGWLRNWMGFENCLMAFYDQPDLIEEMIEYMCEFVLKVDERALNEIKIDAVSMWEDMAFKTQPMISPALFRKYLVPRYKKLSARFRKAGIDLIFIDCDGNINELVELWLNAGINIMFPLEINSGSDPVQLRKRFGKKVLLMGGVDKKALIEGPSAIDRELERIKPVVEEGGYIPHVDHRVPPDVSLKNYLYYLEKKRELFKIYDWVIPLLDKK